MISGNKINRKFICTILTGTLVMSLMMAGGCGKKDIDYSMDNTATSGDSSFGSGTLKDRLGVPENCEIDVPTGNSGLSSIKITADNILLPDTDHMGVYTYCDPEYYPEYKQQICESLFDASAGIYEYDWTQDTKDYYQFYIDRYEEALLYADEKNDTEGKENIQEIIDMYTELISYAPDQYTETTDFMSESFIGSRNDNDYQIIFYSDDIDGIISEIDFLPFPYDSPVEKSNIEGAMTVSYYGENLTDKNKEANMCNMSQEECVEYGRNWLSEIGIDGLAVNDVKVLKWDYYDYSYDIVATEYNGYVIQFVRGINDIPLFYEDLYGVEYLHDMEALFRSDIEEQDDFTGNVTEDLTEDISEEDTSEDAASEDDDIVYEAVDTSQESYTLYITDDGIVEAICVGMAEPAGEITSNADLLSWDQVIDVAVEKLPLYFEEHETSYLDVNFTDVRLGYYRVENPDGTDGYQIIPVWIFMERESLDYGGNEDEDLTDRNYITQIFMINAIDGGVVELKED